MKVAVAPPGFRWLDSLELNAFSEAKVMLGRNERTRPDLVPFIANLLIRRRRALAAERARGREGRESRWALGDAA